jgi:hypothetical protein
VSERERERESRQNWVNGLMGTLSLVGWKAHGSLLQQEEGQKGVVELAIGKWS